MEREDRSGLACSLGREARKDRLEFARAWIDQTARGSGQAILKKVQNEGQRPKALDLSLTLLRSSRPGFGFGLRLGLFFLKCRGKLILQKIPEVITG